MPSLELAVRSATVAILLLTGIVMTFSMIFISSTREPEAPPAQAVRRSAREFRAALMHILRTDDGFRLFLGARMVAQIA